MRLGMTREDVEAIDLELAWGETTLEGDTYPIVVVRLPNRAYFTGIFDLDGRLHRMYTTEATIRDTRGLGVGSTLAQVRSAYPEGRLVLAEADGLHANYATGTHILFGFEPGDIPAECYDDPANCDVPSSIVVIRMSVNPRLSR